MRVPAGIGLDLLNRRLIGVPRAAWLAAAFYLAAVPALAAEGKGPSEAVFVGEIVLLVLFGRLFGEAMQRVGQPAVMGQLLAGLALGPSVLGAAWPDAQRALFSSDPAQKAMLNAMAQFGVLLLLLLAGMETKLATLARVRGSAAAVSLAGILLPFACGYLLGEHMPAALAPDPDRRFVTSLFLGTALSISSVKIVASVVREMNFMRRDVGQLIIASAIIDDTIGWVIIAITFSLAAGGSIDLMHVMTSVGGTLLFLGLSFTIGRRLVYYVIRWTNDHFVSELPVLSAIILLMGLMALTTDAIGVHTVLGAFVAGMLVGDSPILTRSIEDQLRGLTQAVFMPIFFGLAGLHSDLSILRQPELLGMTLALIAIASVGKFAGAFIGAFSSGMSARAALALGCGMNARGSTEVIVATIGLSMGAITTELFTMIVAMAVVTTMVMPPTLRWALRRIPLTDEERRRISDQEFDASSYVSGIERVLVTVDASPSGALAQRLAGVFAAPRRSPITIIELGQRDGEASEGGQARKADEGSQNANGRAAVRGVHVLRRRQDAPAPDVVADEARKGFDLLLVGMEPAKGRRGGFSPEISAVAVGFERSLGVVVARGEHGAPDGAPGPKILIPITGSETSRRGAEFAMAFAAGLGADCEALYVQSGGAGKSFSDMRRAVGEREAVLADLRAVAQHYGVGLEGTIDVGVAPQDAIMRRAAEGGHALIALGVSRRPGEALAFGQVADALLAQADCSLVFLAGPARGEA